MWAPKLRLLGSESIGSAVVEHRLTCSLACGILPDRGSYLCLLHWPVASLPMESPGKPCCIDTDLQELFVYFGD